MTEKLKRKMENLTKKMISDRISEKVNTGEITFGVRKKITEFLLSTINILKDVIQDGEIKTEVFCVCEYIENNSLYSKGFVLTV